MAKWHGKPVLFGKVPDDATGRNFDAVKKAFSELGVAAQGQMTDEISLASGNNTINPPITRPRGRVTCFTSNGAVTITDVGLQSDGTWIVTASGAVTVRFLFIP